MCGVAQTLVNSEGDKRMKQFFACFLSVALCCVMVSGCSESGAVSGSALALVTDTGNIDDRSFNQAVWEGLVRYAEENKITHGYYRPTEQTAEAKLSAIDQAVTGGAELVVLPSNQFEEATYLAQELYPEVHFLLIDGTPQSAAGEELIGANTVAVTFAEQQAGFLAGYAIVKDGSTGLGFMGGADLAPVERYGYGFVQGAEYAAVEMGLPEGAVTVHYTYADTFLESEDTFACAQGWYSEGTEAVFAAAGAGNLSVMAAAEEAGTKVIGADVDQSAVSATVVTSAMKGLGTAVYECIEDYYADEFHGGEHLVFDAKNLGVELAMDNAKFTVFTRSEYDTLFDRLSNDTDGLASAILTDETANAPTELNTPHVTVIVE